MEFLKYQHIEKINTTETEGIENGICYIFPKIDGTNGSIWKDGFQIKAGSRNRELSLENDNAGFFAWLIDQENIRHFFIKYPDIRLYGEWLVPHTIKTYREDAWRKFYVFDVMENENYLDYEKYREILEEYNIDYIPAMCKINNPTNEKLFELLEKNNFLIQDGKGAGEGIVVKNYDYKNRFGRVTWAKIVKNEFKEKLSKNLNFGVPELKNKTDIEEKIINQYVTETLVNKEYAKIATAEGGWSSKFIPRLFGVVYYCLITEEGWNIIKGFNYPVIDYKKLNNLTIQKIKEIKTDLF